MNWHFDNKINLETKYNLFYYNPTYRLVPFFPIESENYLNKKEHFYQIIEFKKCNFTGPVLYCYCHPDKKYIILDVLKDASKFIETNLKLSDTDILYMYVHINKAIEFYKGDLDNGTEKEN